MASALVCTTVAVLPVALYGGLAPLVRAELGFDLRWIGAGAAVFFVTSAGGSVPGGRLADAIGSRRALLVGLAISAVALAGIGLAGRSLAALVTMLGPRRHRQLDHPARREPRTRPGRACRTSGTRFRAQAGRHPGRDRARRLLAAGGRPHPRMARRVPGRCPARGSRRAAAAQDHRRVGAGDTPVERAQATPPVAAAADRGDRVRRGLGDGLRVLPGRVHDRQRLGSGARGNGARGRRRRRGRRPDRRRLVVGPGHGHLPHGPGDGARRRPRLRAARTATSRRC
jgi:hypothetical protein